MCYIKTGALKDGIPVNGTIPEVYANELSGKELVVKLRQNSGEAERKPRQLNKLGYAIIHN